MKKTIDCLIIGYNEMEFESYEQVVRNMGVNSPAYRDLNLNHISINNKLYSATDAFNLFYYGSINSKEGINISDTFYATISYLGSYLNKNNLTFDYIKSFQNEKVELIEKLENNNVLTIAITTTYYVSMFPILEILSLIRNSNTSAKIIIGGPFISNLVELLDEYTLSYMLKEMNADFYINSSQGEKALVDIVDSLKNNYSAYEINNIIFESDDEYVFTHLKSEINLIEDNPINWSLFTDGMGKSAAMRTAISCPFNCSFCGFPKHAGKYQTAGLDKIEQQLNMIESIGKIKNLYFIDDTFNVPPERFKDILKLMIKNKYSFKWHSYYRCQYADEETVKLMKESGCQGVFLGIESGNEQILKNMNKSATPNQFKKGIELLKKYDITTFASFIIGFPGETLDTFKDTYRFIEECQPDFYRAQIWYCEPITPIWERKEEFGIQGSNFEWSHNTMDSKVACDLVDDLFRNIKKSIWLCQYNFDFVSIFSILQRNIKMETIKSFLKLFNEAIEENLKITEDKNISEDLIDRFKKVFDKN